MSSLIVCAQHETVRTKRPGAIVVSPGINACNIFIVAGLDEKGSAESFSFTHADGDSIGYVFKELIPYRNSGMKLFRCAKSDESDASENLIEMLKQENIPYENIRMGENDSCVLAMLNNGEVTIKPCVEQEFTVPFLIQYGHAGTAMYKLIKLKYMVRQWNGVFDSPIGEPQISYDDTNILDANYKSAHKKVFMQFDEFAEASFNFISGFTGRSDRLIAANTMLRIARPGLDNKYKEPALDFLVNGVEEIPMILKSLGIEGIEKLKGRSF